MHLFVEWVINYLIIICGKLYAHLCPPPKDDINEEDQLDKE